MPREDSTSVARKLSGLSAEVRQELVASAAKLRQLQRMISAASAVPILFFLGWPVMVPTLLALLLRVNRLSAHAELREPLAWAATLPAPERPPTDARGAVADLVVVGRSRRTLLACVIGPPAVMAGAGMALWGLLRAL